MFSTFCHPSSDTDDKDKDKSAHLVHLLGPIFGLLYPIPHILTIEQHLLLISSLYTLLIHNSLVSIEVQELCWLFLVEIHRSTVSTDGPYSKSIIEQQS